MTAHPINFDAIREGAAAALSFYPADPPDPKVPPGKHRVLWRDDYWRGIDLAHVCCARAFAGEPIDTVTGHELVYRQRQCLIALGRLDPGEPPEDERAEILCALVRNLRNVGDPEREGPAFPGDLENDADCREEA